ASAVSSEARNSASLYFLANSCWCVEIGTSALPTSWVIRSAMCLTRRKLAASTSRRCSCSDCEGSSTTRSAELGTPEPWLWKGTTVTWYTVLGASGGEYLKGVIAVPVLST